MTDNQWMIVLHITLIILQAIIGIVQYLLMSGLQALRNEMREQFKQM